jgi:hypothetical protein
MREYNGQALCLFRGEPRRHSAAKLLTRNEGGCGIAVNVARLPELPAPRASR